MSFDNYVRLNKRIPPEMLLSISSIDDEEKLSDTLVAHLTNLKLADKQKLLEETDPKVRLEELYGFIQSEIEIMRVEKKIRARVKRQMEKSQKEYYLNEQMQAIQKELGDRGDDSRAEFQEIEAKINKKKLSAEAREKVDKEFRKLKQMSPMSAEATVVRNYLDMILSLPWEEYSEEIQDINVSEAILEADHYGLEKVKERVLEFLSVRLLSQDSKGPILCLIGPPGVGKTSLASSVARATGRKFARVALGGVKDEAEIRGHRRTYIGSMPGKIIMAMKKAGTNNPVILLDEIDKLSSDFRGDPSSALLEVLDPAQNHTFNDHYLDLDFDLSKVLFLATGNISHTIPKPLLDRMEVIHIPGYTDEEKMVIAKRHLVKRQLKENGLTEENLSFSDEAIEELINYYTREAGVRTLERQIGSVIRKEVRSYLKEHTPKAPKVEEGSEITDIVATSKDAKGKKKAKKDLEEDGKKLIFKAKVITPQDIRRHLGPRQFRIGQQNSQDEVGICTGLAWTEVGGELLAVEVNVFPGSGKLIITGKLGEVMQESAQAALSYVKSRSEFLGIKEDYKTIDIHIHVPEGAIPKDGPSAGLCMATALASALTKRPVSKDIAMTGEITLRGRALPIGGLKEKLLAACRGGIKKVMIPEENEKDLEDVPEVVTKTMKIVTVKHMDEVLINALVWESGKKDELYKKLKTSTAKVKDGK